LAESLIGELPYQCPNEKVFAGLAKARAVIERWRYDDTRCGRIRPMAV
jgi:hypothetical protein